jgi:acyl-CoA hydrolase
MSEINFTSSAKQGDIIEIGIEVVNLEHRLRSNVKLET